MFGKPEWFSKKKVGWGVRPVSWRGWLYAAIWAGVICLPFALLLTNRLLIESLVWAVVMMVALLWDVRHVRRELDARPSTAGSRYDSDVLIIDEQTEPDPTYFATRSYDLHQRR